MAVILLAAAKHVIEELQGNCRIQVYTADELGAGTNSQVYIKIYGEDGITDDVPLGDKDDDYFETGTCSEFDVNFPEDLGKIYKIRVWIDNSGAAPDWYLDKIVFVRLDGTIVFPCDQWFSDSKDDEQLIRELPAVYEDEDPLPLVNYNVCVKTGKRRSAGTRANVYIEIHGERGDTGRRPLDDHNYVEKDNKFVRTAIDNFVIQAVSLGDINKLVVGHDGSRRRPRWYLKRVIVTDVENEKVYFFNHRRWISEEDDDCTLEHAVEVEFEEAESSSEDEGSSSSSSSSSDDEEE